MKRAAVAILAIVALSASNASEPVVSSQPAWADARTPASLRAAIAACAAEEKTIIVSAPVAMGAATVLGKCDLRFVSAGRVDVAAGAVLAIKGNVAAGRKRIFGGQGTVSLSGSLQQEVFPEWWGAKGDGSADDFPAFKAATSSGAATVTIQAPPVAYKLGSPLTVSGVNFVGSGSSAVRFDCHGAGTCVTWSSATGGRVGGFTLTSRAKHQSGFLLSGGTVPVVFDVYVKEFDTIGIQLGMAGVSGAYFADVNGVQAINRTTRGRAALVIDGGGHINSNANTVRNYFAKGNWETLVEIRGNKNMLYGGDAEFNPESFGATVAVKVSGSGNQLLGPYMEQMGASFVSRLVWFTPTASGNVVTGAHVAAKMPAAGGWDRTIVNEGKNNVIEWESRGQAAGRLEGTREFEGRSIAPGTCARTTIRVRNAEPGDFAAVSYSEGLNGASATAEVSAASTVSVSICNPTTQAIELPPGRLRVRAEK